MSITRSMSLKLKRDGELEKTKGQGERGVLSEVCSRHSQGSKNSSGNALLVAQLKEKHLKEELRLEAEAVRNNHERQLLRARNEVELAKLEVSLPENLEDVPHSHRSGLSESSVVRISSYLEDCRQVGSPKSPYEQPVDELEECKDKGFANFRYLESIVEGLELPKVDLIQFDGNPRGYWRFVRQFELYIESKTKDDGKRLVQLVNSCTGAAREAIEDCLMLPASEGYDRARRILKESFGRSHLVARAVIDDLVKSFRMASGKAKDMTQLAFKMQNCQIALSQMNYSAELSSLENLDRLVKCLPTFLQQKWAEFVDQVTHDLREPTFEDLVRFIGQRARVLNSRYGILAEARSQKDIGVRIHSVADHGKNRQLWSNAIIRAEPASDVKCKVCGSGHPIVNCERFIAFDVQKRWSTVKSVNVCFLCLKSDHKAKDCQSRLRCGTDGCRAKHHALLHSKPPNKTHQEVSIRTCNAMTDGKPDVSLGLLPVRLKGPSAELLTYAFIDSGSDTTIVRGNLLHQLGVQIEKAPREIQTISGSCGSLGDSGCFQVCPIRDDETVFVKGASVVSEILPSMIIDSRCTIATRWPHLRDLPFDDIPSKSIGILIGCDVPEAHWVLDQRLGGRKEPFGVKTPLGWVILGPQAPDHRGRVVASCLSSVEPSVEDQLRVLYNADFADIDSLRKTPSAEDRRVIEFVSERTEHIGGHFIVPLPWKAERPTGPSNFSAALSRLNSLRKRFLHDTGFFHAYAAVMSRNLEKGYAVPVPPELLTSQSVPRWYLPHHAVFNPRKPGKMRVVFDCAAKHGGRSLNDLLLQGPDTTADLVGILLKFRRDRVAVSADVEEMFMQVQVPQIDQGALRFLWFAHNDLHNDPVEFQMTSHVFGAISSPFCANFALRQTTALFGKDYNSRVTSAVTDNFYVDDCLVSLPSIADAKSFVHEITELLARGGFHLRKWMSNVPEAVQGLPSSERVQAVVEVLPNTLDVQRALGIEWDPSTDTLCFRFNIPEKPLTRRGILASICSLFDPLGLVAPLCLSAKQLLQGLCKVGLGWDSPLSEDQAAQWYSWLKLVKSIGVVRYPRCLVPEGFVMIGSPELHVFSDASEAGYGVAAYARFASNDGRVVCRLIFGKSRVAPLKTVTVPRLELAAAALAARVYRLLSDSLPGLFSSVTLWTDSQIVLYYINNQSARFCTFVANRLAIIHEYSSLTQWKHVKSSENPADLASRGIKGLDDLNCWMNGPTCINEQKIAALPIALDRIPDGVELKKIRPVINAISTSSAFQRLFARCSSWFKLLKSIAWLRRFTRYLMYKFGKTVVVPIAGHIQVKELTEARTVIVRQIQAEVYSEEIARLTSDTQSKPGKGSALRKLCPILLDGVLCVGGRLQYSNHALSMKHPPILPSKHPVVDLLIQHCHETEGHCGVSHVLGVLRQNVWVVHGSQSVKRVLHKCVQCRKRSGTTCQQLMAPLPSVRSEKGRKCFDSVGLDYFGPFLIKRGRSMEKRYGCIFSCMATRAVHLEVAHSLTTDSFIMALMRFVGRRGRPLDIYSDNGSNFVGAVSELREHILLWDQAKINDRLLARGIQWHFNPPLASHRGGVWERMIRSVRQILFVLIQEQVLSDESLATLFVEVERILNDRPLTPVSPDCRDAAALTPNHLLLHESNAGFPSHCSLRERLTRRWKQVNYLSGVFWSRWVKEYVPTLQLRHKWLSRNRNLRTGDVVLVVSEHLSRGSWPLGLVTECQKDADGLVRTVLLRTSSGVIKRDVRSLCWLEGDD